MSGFTTAFPDSMKVEMATAIHNFSSGGDLFGLALGIGTPAGTFGAATANYSDLGADEVPNGSGYTTGGFLWTNVQNITPALGSGEAFWSWSVNPTWTGTISTSGCIGYNRSKSNKCVYVGSFGGILIVSSNVLTLVLPTNAAGSSILGLK